MQERFDMFAAPGNSGHLFAAHGFDPHGTLPEAGLFYRSTDGGAHWSAMLNVKSVLTFNFGKTKPGGSAYRTIFLQGYVDLQDNADLGSSMTWKNIGDGYPIFDYPSALAGD
jgi:hypothetical protein